MQFDVYENPCPRMRDVYANLLHVQSDLPGSLAITSLSTKDLPRWMCPLIGVASQSVLLVPFEAAPLDKRLRRTDIQFVRDRSHDIIEAMDAVLGGI